MTIGNNFWGVKIIIEPTPVETVSGVGEVLFP